MARFKPDFKVRGRGCFLLSKPFHFVPVKYLIPAVSHAGKDSVAATAVLVVSFSAQPAIVSPSTSPVFLEPDALRAPAFSFDILYIVHEDPDKITYFAATNSRGKEIPFGIKRKDRARHMYVIGKTGMGKSTLLENMAIQDIRNGEGMAFIDPHGSTAERLLEYIPENRKNDVLYFAPFDMDYPVAFNVMEDVGYDKRHLVVSGLLSAFRKIWVDAWSARMEYILSNTLLALLEYPGATLLDVNRMLVGKAFRKKVIDNVKDPTVKAFWVEEFANYTDRYTQDATPAIQNKVGQFTSNPLIRNIVGQPKSSFDIRKMMDEKKIIIINLSKGRVGEVNATLLGSMLVTKIYLAAMSRADVSAAALATMPNFYFYVDEFQTFANESFADILSEARKYKLNLLIAHQYIEQMEEEVRNAVFGNVGTTVTFRVGPFDAEVLEKIFEPQFTAEDLVNLGFAQVYLTLMIDGVGSPPFSATTLPPFDPPPAQFVNDVVASSRTQFSAPRDDVEKAIAVWQAAETGLEKDEKPSKPRPASRAPASRAEPGAHAPASLSSASYGAPQPERPPAALASAPVPPSPPPPARPAAPAPHRPVEPRRETVSPRSKSASPNHLPLVGAKSLRDAIEKATGEKPPQPSQHSPDLKDALKKIIPPTNAPEPARAAPLPPESSQPSSHQKQPRKPAAVPEHKLREMLEVKDVDGNRNV